MPRQAPPAVASEDPAAEAILTALADGTARTAAELAALAGLAPRAAASATARLLEDGLLVAERDGRRRYLALAEGGIARILARPAGAAAPPARNRAPRAKPTAANRFARRCHGHLAGALGVALAAALARAGMVRPGPGRSLIVSRAGRARLVASLGIDPAALIPGRDGIAWRCADWAGGSWHLGGPLGRRILERMVALGWVECAEGARAVRLGAAGAAALAREFAVVAPPAPRR